jgi:hypothetical protein
MLEDRYLARWHINQEPDSARDREERFLALVQISASKEHDFRVEYTTLPEKDC